MLVDFKVTNFRSFKTEQEFSMEPGQYLRKYSQNIINNGKKRLLKSGVIFGANANGKTNLIKAIQMLKELIVSPTDAIEDKLPCDTFGNNDENTKFEITFISNKKEYCYFLEYNEEAVVTENLKVNNRLVFSRQGQNFEVPKQIRNLKENIRKNQLLLYFAQKNNEVISIEVYRWFVNDLIVINPNQIEMKKIKKLENKDFKEKLLCFLQAADFDITDIKVEKTMVNIDPILLEVLRKSGEKGNDVIDKAKKFPEYNVYCTHQSVEGDFTLDLRQESRGTQVFMVISLYLLESKNKVLLVDEFDRSFHTELAQALLKTINSETQSNQFILTTHNPDLMDCQLRQDQIWFVDKNMFNKELKKRYSETRLFSLFDFDDAKLTRHDISFKKRYLQGLYGGTQIVNQSLLEASIENESQKEK